MSHCSLTISTNLSTITLPVEHLDVFSRGGKETPPPYTTTIALSAIRHSYPLYANIEQIRAAQGVISSLVMRNSAHLLEYLAALRRGEEVHRLLIDERQRLEATLRAVALTPH